MSPHQCIAVAVRLFAVWLAVYSAWQVPPFYIYATGQNEPKLLAIILVAATFCLVLVLALWRFPLTVAKKLLSSALPKSPNSASPDLWLAMGCALTGLWLLTQTVPPIAQDLIGLYRTGITYIDQPGLRPWLAYRLLMVVLSLWLILGARGFRRLFWWARNAGRSRPPNDT